jgi:hypothetical protein
MHLMFHAYGKEKFKHSSNGQTYLSTMFSVHKIVKVQNSVISPFQCVYIIKSQVQLIISMNDESNLMQPNLQLNYMNHDANLMV